MIERGRNLTLTFGLCMCTYVWCNTHTICKHWVKKWELPGFSKTEKAVPCRVNVISLSAGWWERGKRAITESLRGCCVPASHRNSGGCLSFKFYHSFDKAPTPDESDEELRWVGLVCGLRKALLWWLSA